MNNRFETPMGTFQLNRNREEKNRSLQAWNSADLYILDNLDALGLKEGSSVLLFNDAFGALSIPLSSQHIIYSYSDSFCAEKMIRENLILNDKRDAAVRFLSPGDELPENIDLIIIKNPKSLNYLEYQLQQISLHYKGGIPVLAADMSKNIHSSTVTLFESFLAEVKTSLAWRKARLLHGMTIAEKNEGRSFPVEYKPVNFPYAVLNYPNLFAFGRLDPGSAFMINHFPDPASRPVNIIDLACGDGILALEAARKWPDAKILCVDESHLAVRSARESFERNGLGGRGEYKVTDVLEGVDEESADLILCNPPFHDSHSLSTSTAMRMFSQSHEVLKRGGELHIIANRHLGYEKTLRKIYSHVELSASNRKFVIIRALK